MNFFTSDAKALPLFQEGLINGAFGTALMPDLLFAGEFKPEEWANDATSVIKTKRGTMAPDAQKLAFKTDPTIGTYENEQYEVAIFEVGRQMSADNVAGNLARFSLWEKDMGALATGAAKTKMMGARSALFNAGLYGSTICTTTGNNATKTLLKLNGFTRMFNGGGRLATVSATNPLPVWFIVGGSYIAANVIGFTPAPIVMANSQTVSDCESLAGTITLDGNVDTGSSGRVAVVAATASYRIFSGGSANYSVDDLTGTGSDLAGMDILLAAAHLKDTGVHTFEDNHYHAHISPIAMYQLLKDPDVQLLNRGTGLDPKDTANPYVTGRVAVLGNVLLFENSYCPQPGARVYAANIGEVLAAETRNAANKSLHTAIVMGDCGLVENWRTPLAATIGSNGVPSMSKVGNWIEDGSYLKTVVDHIELVLSAPTDSLGRVPRMAYSYTGAWEVPTDYLSDIDGSALDAITGRAAYKGIVPIIHTV